MTTTETRERELVTIDGMLIDAETGEIAGVADAVPEEDAESLALWLGERKTWLEAQLQARRAEKEFWIQRVDERFDPQIRDIERSLEWILGNPVWTRKLREYAKQQLEGAKKRSFNVGLLKLGFRTKPGGLRVVDDKAALDYVSDHDELVDRCVTVSYRLRATDYIALREEIEGLPGIEDVPAREVFLLDGQAVEVEEGQQ